MKFWLKLAGCCNNFVTIAPLSDFGNRGKVLPTNMMKAISAVERFASKVERRISRRASPIGLSTLNAQLSTRRPHAFSLIELLVVMAVIAIMLSLLLPAITGFNSTAGRRGAVNTLMNTFEQSRVAALEAGRTVYVLFARPDFPEQDAIMVVRETESGTGPYEQLTKWIKLPKGVLLHDPTAGNNLLKAGQTGSGLDTTRLPAASPVAAANLGVLVFNEAGGIAFPSADKTQRKLIVSEGVRGSGGTEALISGKKQGAGGFEIISLSRYTGRSQLDVTTVQ